MATETTVTTEPRREDDKRCVGCHKLLRRFWRTAVRFDPTYPAGQANRVFYEPQVGDPFVDYGGTTRTILAVRKKRGSSTFGTHDVWCGDWGNQGARDAPFCTNRCAVAFAIHAYRSGHRS